MSDAMRMRPVRSGTLLSACVVLVLTPSLANAANVQRGRDGSASASALDLSNAVTEAAQRFQIPAQWIRAIVHIESGGDAEAVSPKGAIGLMQIMPATWAAMRAEYDLGDDPFQPHDNILAGTAYLRRMLDRFGLSGFLAAYNAGPARYEQSLATGLPLPSETHDYVARLEPVITASAPAAPLSPKTAGRSDVAHSAIFPQFIVSSGRSSAEPEPQDGKTADGIFAADALTETMQPHGNAVADLTAIKPFLSATLVRGTVELRPESNHVFTRQSSAMPQ